MKDKHFEPLDSEEKELMESIKNDEFVSIRKNREKEISDAMQRAQATLKKDKRMNIRISERDLKNLKIRALEEGIPYQTLVSMVLHKYLSGKLKETA
ncbi:antitoxin [Marispirochaeta aestuarii]|uniref:Antitoxin n=1 Tax=Marispirochaeta aestuarii TaxID=1963862 RepID=A0A1Y1RWQ9_9SPIO|nr:CopG family antitoxin [Marispirochaeta aestuarii]ORC34654.1 antitoxin [Marispirochaeta aestuarii]